MVRFSAALLLALTHAGCSTTSTIYRQRGAPIEGRIQGGSPTAIAVLDDDGTRIVPRSEIADIDHPGNVHATVGGIVFGFGLLVAATSYPACRRESATDSASQSSCIGTFVPAGVGVGLVIWGLTQNLGARNRWADDSLVLDEGLPTIGGPHVEEAPSAVPPSGVPPPPPAPPPAPAPAATPPPSPPAPSPPAPEPAREDPAAPPSNTRSFPPGASE